MDWPTAILSGLGILFGSGGIAWALGRKVSAFFEIHERRTDVQLAAAAVDRKQDREALEKQELRHAAERAAEANANRAELEKLGIVFERSMKQAVDDCARQREIYAQERADDRKLVFQALQRLHGPGTVPLAEPKPTPTSFRQPRRTSDDDVPEEEVR